jgi:hypothetical protein
MLGFGFALTVRFRGDFDTLAAHLFKESYISLVPEQEFQVLGCEVGLEIAHIVSNGDWLNFVNRFKQ